MEGTSKEKLETLSKIAEVYNNTQLYNLSISNIYDTIEELEAIQEENNSLGDQVSEYKEYIDNLKLTTYIRPNNLYDVQKAELCKQLYDNCTLEELERIIQFIK